MTGNDAVHDAGLLRQRVRQFEWPVVDNCGEIMLEFGRTYQIARTTGSVGINTAWRRVRARLCSHGEGAASNAHQGGGVAATAFALANRAAARCACDLLGRAGVVVVAIVVAAAFHLSRTRCTSRDVRYASGRGQVAIVPGLARGLIRAAAARPTNGRQIASGAQYSPSLT